MLHLTEIAAFLERGFLVILATAQRLGPWVTLIYLLVLLGFSAYCLQLLHSLLTDALAMLARP
jgi:hypothetical protein